MKLEFAAAFSYNPKLLILDEATSGLDPIFRDEILDIIREYTEDETHTFLLSSHITSDLDNIADYIAFLHEGKLLFVKTYDEISKFDDSLLTFPLTKREIVGAQFIACLSFCGITSLLAFAETLLFVFVHKCTDFKTGILLLIALSASLLLLAGSYKLCLMIYTKKHS